VSLGATVVTAEPWPPQAWTDGRVADLDAEALTLLLAGLQPGTPQAAQVRHDLDRLDTLPPGSRDLATTALRGLGLATWHQQRALSALTPAERDLVRAASPDGPRDEATRSALARIDLGEVWAAELALQDASAQILRQLRPAAPADPGFAQDLAKRLGASDAAAPAPVRLEDAFARLSGLPANSGEVQDAAAAVPADARLALQPVFAALLPLSAGNAAAHPEAVAALARAVEAAQPALLAWSQAAAAEQGQRTLQPPTFVLPNPDAARPPLRLGLPALTDGRAGEPQDLGAALAELARALDDPAGAAGAADVAARIEAADPSLAAPIADVLHAAAAYITASEQEAAGTGAFAAPATEAATWESLAAAVAQQELLAAVERLVASLEVRQADAAPADAPCVGVDGNVPGYLMVDPCGVASEWTPGDQAILLVDTGGDDHYLGRHGGAPFQTAFPVTGDRSAIQARRIPISIVVDLGGSDTYDSQGEPCAQGAACADTAPGNDTSGQSGVQPVGVLIDWDGDGAHATNTFTAGDRSQGYAGDAAVFSPGSTFEASTLQASVAHWAEASTGLLVEGVGRDGTLESRYKAGEFSQGSGLYNVSQGPDGSNRYPRGSRGELIRLVGSESHADATFEAAGHSQGASQGGLPVPTGSGGVVTLAGFCAGVLLNVAGQDAVSNDSYSAGDWSQAAVLREGPSDGLVLVGSFAALVDAGGPGSRSNDRYQSTNASLGYQAPFATEHITPDVNGIPPVVDLIGTQSGQSSLQAIFLDAIAPASADASSVQADPAGVVVDPHASASSNADQYRVVSGPDHAFGRNGAVFVDLGGQDDYPPPDLQDWPRNDGSNAPAALASSSLGLDDGSLDDADRDLMPSGVEGAWTEFVGLWRADDGDDRMGPGPAPARILVDATGTALHLDEPYALVLTAGGEQDTYGAHFSAVAHLDLAGNDIHLDPAASGWGVAERALDHIKNLQPQPPLDRPLLSFLLDLSGNDHYRWAGDRAQGSGGAGGAGLLFDLDGRDEYVSGRQSQGYGTDNGVGVLVDATAPAPGAAPQSNRFQAAPPSQGKGEGGVGILAATSAHNTFADGTHPTPDDVHPGPGGVPTGVSVNEGTNQPPSFEWSGPVDSADVAAGARVPLTAQLEDPEGDPMRACWTIEPEAEPLCVDLDGNGMAQANYTWVDVPTHAGGNESIPYQVRLDVTDSGGLSVASEVRTILVHDPPPLAGGLLGPAVVRAGKASAYQLPFTYTPAMEGHTLVFDAGDGTGNQTFDDHFIDWASALAGASIRAPAGYPLPADPDANGLPAGTDPHNPLAFAVDGNPATSAMLTSNAATNGPIHAEVRFAGPRQVRSVFLVADVTQLSNPVTLAVDALGADGSVQALPPVTVGPTTQPFVFPLPTFPTLSGIALTQVMGGSDPGQAQVRIYELSANGPGALHAWPPGHFVARAQILDRFGATSKAADAAIDAVGAGAGRLAPPALQYLGIGGLGGLAVNGREIIAGAGTGDSGRGPVLQASLAALQSYTILLQSTAVPVRAQTLDCIDWGDGSSECFAHPTSAGGSVLRGSTLPWHSWAHGDHTVVVTTKEPGASPRTIATIEVHAETALDLRAPLPPQTPSSLPSALPILYLSLDDTRTWHQRIPFLATIDAGGDDRYIGRVAAPLDVQSTAAQADLGAFPSLVVDAAGDDDYLSTEAGAQAFAWRGAAALLVDAAGNDLYVAPAASQGAALEGGAAVLADLGGNDRFNPVPAGHPDVARGYANRTDAWTGRPPSLTGPALPLPADADLLQGAAVEGIGILALSGGLDLLQANGGSQGFGAHDVATAAGYAEADPDCVVAGSGPNPPANAVASARSALCAFGVNDTDPDDYVAHYVTPLQTYVNPANPTNPTNPPSGAPGNTPWCVFGGGGGVQTPPVPCKRPNVTGLQNQALQGPRPGPGFGALVQADGILAALSGASSQGASEGLGRGIFADSDGGDLLLASTASQAASHGGTAALLLGGGSAMRLLSDGQGSYSGPVGPTLSSDDPDGRTVFVAPGADLECSPGPCDGDASHSFEPDGLNGDGAGPQVTVAGAPSDVRRGGPILLHVDVDGAAPSYDYAVFRVVRGWKDASPGGTCAGPALAPPRLLAQESDAPPGLSVTIDLAAEGREAGCTEIHAFARPAGEGPWGHGVATLHLLPPPAGLTADAMNLVSSGASTPQLNATLAEPLARSLPPTLQIRFEGPGHADVNVDYHLDDLGNLAIPLPVPASLPAGHYGISLRARWLPSEPFSDWQETPATLDVDRSAPSVSFDPLPAAWPRAQPLQLHGLAQDVSGVDHLSLRLVDPGTGKPIPLQAVVPGAVTCLDQAASFDTNLGDECATASLIHISNETKDWSVSLLPIGSFVAGVATVQARAVDNASADSGWKGLGNVFFDAEPPALLSLTTTAGSDSIDPKAGLALVATFADAEAPHCAACPGSGLDFTSVRAVLYRQDGASARTPLQRDEDLDGADRLGFRWTGAPLDAGAYAVEVFASDHAGNLRAWKPGVPLFVDSISPTLLQSPRLTLPSFTLANGTQQGQTALKPGDVVQVAVDAIDNIGIGAAKAVFGGDRLHAQPLDGRGPADAGVRVTGNVTVPNAPGSTLKVWVEVADRAGNSNRSANATYPFYPTSFQASSLELTPRVHSALVGWTSDRALHYNVTITGPSGPVSAVGFAPAGHHQALLGNLTSSSDHAVQVEFWDDAGWLLSRSGALKTLPEPNGTTLEITAVPIRVRSGAVEVSGRLVNPPAGLLTLRDGPNGPVVAQQPVAAASGVVRFTLRWDTRSAHPGGLQDVPVTVVLDTGELSWSDSAGVSIDNGAPTLALDIQGAAPRNGWYPSALQVGIGGTDDTTPIAVQATLDGKPVDGTIATIADEGAHRLEIVLQDGASPPNVLQHTLDLQVDRTPPELSVAGVPRYVSSRTLAYIATASDARSGLDGLRSRAGAAGAAWSNWTAEAPTSAAVPADASDGDFFLDVEARDRAGNVRRAAFPFTLDRVAPEVVAARWIGWAGGPPAPVLFLAARDGINATTSPAGVAAARFAPSGSPDAWGPWVAADGRSALSVQPSWLDAGGAFLQVQDAAGNPSAVVRVPASPAPPESPVPAAAAPGNGSRQPPVPESASVDPPQGTQADRFLFSSVVPSWNGEEPLEVYVKIGNVLYPAEPAGPLLEQGGRLYAASVQLEPSHLSKPYLFHFVVRYAGAEVETPDQPGPLVAALGAGPGAGAAAPASSPHSSPAAGLLLASAALALAAIVRSRKQRR
jgi:hypothetical protein